MPSFDCHCDNKQPFVLVRVYWMHWARGQVQFSTMESDTSITVTLQCTMKHSHANNTDSTCQLILLFKKNKKKQYFFNHLVDINIYFVIVSGVGVDSRYCTGFVYIPYYLQLIHHESHV